MRISSSSVIAFREQFRTLDLFARFELILSAALGLGLAVSIPWVMTSNGVSSHWEHFAIQALAMVISGNFAHNFVFYWQMRRIPEFRTWVQQYRFMGLRIEFVLGLVFVGIWSVVRFVYVGSDALSRNPTSYTHATFLLFYFLINGNHTLAQTRGISFVYSFHLGSPAALREKMHSWERKFSLLVLGLECFVLAAGFYLYLTYVRTGEPLSYQDFDLNFIHIIYARFAMEVVALIALVWFIWYLDPRIWIMKLLFYVRMLPRILIGLHPAALFASYGAHGIESVWMQSNITRNSPIKKSRHLLFEFLGIYLFFGALYLFFYANETRLDWNSRLAIELQPLFVAMAFTHYLAEGFFFRFRNSVTRENLAPLLRISALNGR